MCGGHEVGMNLTQPINITCGLNGPLRGRFVSIERVGVDGGGWGSRLGTNEVQVGQSMLSETHVRIT